MPSDPKYRKRCTTIQMPADRAAMIHEAADRAGVSAHVWIQSCITAGLMTTARTDPEFASEVMQIADVDWQALLQFSDKECVRQLLDIEL